MRKALCDSDAISIFENQCLECRISDAITTSNHSTQSKIDPLVTQINLLPITHASHNLFLLAITHYSLSVSLHTHTRLDPPLCGRLCGPSFRQAKMQRRQNTWPQSGSNASLLMRLCWYECLATTPLLCWLASLLSVVVVVVLLSVKVSPLMFVDAPLLARVFDGLWGS